MGNPDDDNKTENTHLPEDQSSAVEAADNTSGAADAAASEDDREESILEKGRLPVLPLRDVVVYPYMVIPLFVGRKKSIRALDSAMSKDKKIMLAAQKSAEVDEPGDQDIHLSLIHISEPTRPY